MIDELINISEDQEIYLHDIDLNVYHNLKESDYEIFLNSGYYDSRFEIVFSNEQNSLSTDEFDDENKCIETLQSRSGVLRICIIAFKKRLVSKIPFESVFDWKSCLADFTVTSASLFNYGL